MPACIHSPADRRHGVGSIGSSVDVFNAAGLPAARDPDMLSWLRYHVPLCIAFESVSVAGVRRKGGASWREAMVIARGVQESFALIRGLGYDVYPAAKARIGRSPAWAVASVLWTSRGSPRFAI